MIEDTLVDTQVGRRMPLRKEHVELIEADSDIWMGNKGKPTRSREPSVRRLQCGDRSLLDLYRHNIIHLNDNMVFNRLRGRWMVF